jgi:hypothetical protein
VHAGSVLSKMIGQGASIPAGYHALRQIDPSTLSSEEAAERDECNANARIQAIEEANAIYGTNATYPNITGLTDLDQQRELSRLTMIAQAELDCRSLVAFVSSSETIELPFTDQPQTFTW